MITLIQTVEKNEVFDREVTLTKEQHTLYVENEYEFFKKHGEELKWIKGESIVKQKEWNRIYTKSTPY